MTRLIDGTKPYKVRASCGHIDIRRMRESTAGVPYSDDVVLDAPNGAPCRECEAARLAAPPDWTRRISCGCCTNGCCCLNHMDIPNGRRPQVCEYHSSTGRVEFLKGGAA